jgi:HEAT repeat protein
MPYDDATAVSLTLRDLTLQELLLLIGDAERGYKTQAMELLLERGLDESYQALEAALRDDDNADLRNGAMEVLVKFGKFSLPRLKWLLRDANEEVRNFSAVMLGEIGSRMAVGALIQALGDPDCNVSHSAAEALGKIGDRAALVPLLELLKGDFWQQFPAITAIGALRDYRAVPHLLQLLEHELLAGAVIEALGKIGDPRALYPLANMLPYVDDGMSGSVVRAMVAINLNLSELRSYKNTLSEYSQGEQLGNLVSRRGVERLKSLLQREGDREAVEAAVMLLGWLGEIAALDDLFRLLADERYLQVVEGSILSMGRGTEKGLSAALGHENRSVRIVALRLLRALGVSCHPEQLAGLIALDDEALQLEVLETLNLFPEEALLSRLLLIVENGSDKASHKAAEVLGKYPLGKVLDFFGLLAHAHDARRRRRAAMLLGHLKEAGGSASIEALFQDEDAQVRREVVRAIGLQRVAGAIPLLRLALGDPEPSVRESAVLAAAGFGEPVLLQEILQLLGSGDRSLDYSIIRALGLMEARDAGSWLMQYLDRGDLSRQQEYALLETLGKIAYKEASPLVSSRYLRHEEADFRRLAVSTLGSLGDRESLRGVEEAACDPHWSVRIAALHVLGKIGGSRELPLLLKGIADPDPMVRKHAIIILGDLRNGSTVPELVMQLNDSEVGKFAFEALLKFGRCGLPWLHRLMKKNLPVELRERVVDLVGKMGDSKSVEPLLELLEDPSQSIRLAAIDSISYCYDTLPLKRLIQLKKSDPSEEVQSRADLALRTFTMQKCL